LRSPRMQHSIRGSYLCLLKLDNPCLVGSSKLNSTCNKASDGVNNFLRPLLRRVVPGVFDEL
jgi:hypothetical protein